ncbi:MAG: hypothetical protein JWN31_62 [Frankiales bacterium]|nr:hypothetical protein [Frankiales bacterium]
MTAPRRDAPLSPVRRRGGGGQASQAQESYADAEVARGQADAVLGALGRMQLRLDVLGREQSEALGSILAQLEQLTARLDRLEDVAPPAAGGPQH